MPGVEFTSVTGRVPGVWVPRRARCIGPGGGQAPWERRGRVRGRRSAHREPVRHAGAGLQRGPPSRRLWGRPGRDGVMGRRLPPRLPPSPGHPAQAIPVDDPTAVDMAVAEGSRTTVASTADGFVGSQGPGGSGDPPGAGGGGSADAGRGDEAPADARLRTRGVVMVVTRADSIGGAQMHVLHLAQGLRQRGIPVLVVTGPPGPFTEALYRLRIPFRTVPHLVRPVRPLADLRALLELRRLLRRRMPALVAAHSTKATWLARLAAASLGIPCVVTVHGWPWELAAGQAATPSPTTEAAGGMARVDPQAARGQGPGPSCPGGPPGSKGGCPGTPTARGWGHGGSCPGARRRGGRRPGSMPAGACCGMWPPDWPSGASASWAAWRQR